MNNHDIDSILTTPCLICGRENRYHRIFWSPRSQCYIRQMIEDEWLEPGVVLVKSSDHYACIDNLEYLEYKYENKKAS